LRLHFQGLCRTRLFVHAAGWRTQGFPHERNRRASADWQHTSHYRTSGNIAVNIMPSARHYVEVAQITGYHSDWVCRDKRQAASSLCLALALRTNAFAVLVTASRSTIASASSKPLLSPHPTQKLLPASELPQLPELSSQPPVLLRCFEPQYGSRCCSCLLVKRWERRLYLLRSILNFEFSEHSTHAHRRLVRTTIIPSYYIVAHCIRVRRYSSMA
jgi:hypothetical protein